MTATAAGAVQRLLDEVGRQLRGGVLPCPHHCPSQGGKACVSGTVALSVRVQLLRPPFRVRDRDGLVVGALVPEAAVDEDHNTRAREHDVGSTAEGGLRPVVHSKAAAASVEDAPQLDLGFGVLRALARHAPRDGLR